MRGSLHRDGTQSQPVPEGGHKGRPYVLAAPPQVHFLGGADAAAQFNLVSQLQENQLQSRRRRKQIRNVVIAEVGEAKDFALHAPLAVGNDGPESDAHFFDDGA